MWLLRLLQWSLFSYSDFVLKVAICGVVSYVITVMAYATA